MLVSTLNLTLNSPRFSRNIGRFANHNGVAWTTWTFVEQSLNGQTVRSVFLAMTAMMMFGCSGKPQHNRPIIFGATDDSPGYVLPTPKGAQRIGTKFGRCRFTIDRSGIDLRPSVENAKPNIAEDVACEVTKFNKVTVNEWKNTFVAHFRIDTPDGTLYAVVSNPTSEVLDELRPCFGSVKLNTSDAD